MLIKKKSFYIILPLIIYTIACNGKKKSNDYFLESWNSLYLLQRDEFANNTYPSLDYFCKPFLIFEHKVDSLQQNFFKEDKNSLIEEVYNSLPRDYFNWDQKEIENFFVNIDTEKDLAISCLALKTLVLQRLSVLHKSATFEITSIKPSFVKDDSDNGYYGKFIIEGSNYLQPTIVTINNDTLPYLEDGFTPFLLNAPDFKKNEKMIANVICFSWGDTLTYEVEIKK